MSFKPSSSGQDYCTGRADGELLHRPRAVFQHVLQHRKDPSGLFPESSLSPHPVGCERDHEADLQMPRCVRELHHPDLLAAAA